MPPAVAAAGITAAATIGGAMMTQGAQRSAANAATQAQNGATNAQLQLGRESLAAQKQMFDQNMGLNRDIYNSNYQTLSPFVGNGMVASNAMNALLGLPAAQPMTSPLTQPSAPVTPAPATPAPATAALGAQGQLTGPHMAGPFGKIFDALGPNLIPALTGFSHTLQN
jgi:hypothetical protein